MKRLQTVIFHEFCGTKILRGQKRRSTLLPSKNARSLRRHLYIPSTKGSRRALYFMGVFAKKLVQAARCYISQIQLLAAGKRIPCGSLL